MRIESEILFDETVCNEVNELYGKVVTVQYSREITIRRADCTTVEPRRNMPFNEGTYFNTHERGFLEQKVNDTKIIRVPPQSKIFVGYQKPVRISRGKAFFKTMMNNVSDVFIDDFEMNDFFDDVLNFPLEEITNETSLEEVPEEGGTLFIIILLFIVLIPLLVIGAVIWVVIKRLRVKKV